MNDSLKTAFEYVFAWHMLNEIDIPLELCLKAAYAFKTLPFFQNAITRLVKALWNGYIGGEFIETLKNLISGQLRRAYEQAWKDEGSEGKLPDYLATSAAQVIEQQQGFVEGFYHDIVDAKVEGRKIEPFLGRVDMWSNRYNQAYDDALHQITLEEGGKEQWVYGDTEHCDTCAALNGIVAFAREWEAAGFRPQNAPNAMLDCGGWKCQCKRQRTDQRRSPKALEMLMNIATQRA